MFHKIRWTALKIDRRIALMEPYIYQKSMPVSGLRYMEMNDPGEAPPVGSAVDDQAWCEITEDSYWGKWLMNFTMRGHFKIPLEWGNDQTYALHLPISHSGDFSDPESMVYIDGVAYAAADRHHREITLDKSLCDGKSHLLALHGWTGRGSDDDRLMGNTQPYIEGCAVVQINTILRKFLSTARIALSVSQEVCEHDPVKNNLLNVLNSAFNVLDLREPIAGDFYESVLAANTILQEGISQAGRSLDVDIIAVGHAHLDVAWLWPVSQTRRKAARTFRTALHLLKEFPEYHFMQSQPQLYEFVEQDAPEIFDSIRRRVEEGRWEIIGGTWVEPDINTIGSESLVRQFLLGRNYFREHFGGTETPVLWLPDTFGYSWALPQLIKEAGLNYFITHKLSWNQYNKLPFQSFWWQGLDGTRVLTHFLTTPGVVESDAGSSTFENASNYNAEMTPKEMLGTWKQYQQKESHHELIAAYGYGDGGGGPNRQMLENLQIMRDFPGLPRVRPGTVREFMKGLEEISADKFPVWNGELYFEYHRGTYTSQAKTKRNNRKCEYLLHDAEFLATGANYYTGFSYPRVELQRAWQLLCLNQFHDILPGTSIPQVYQDSERDYSEIRDICERVMEGALIALAPLFSERADFIVLNPTSFDGCRIGLIPEKIEKVQTIVDISTGNSLPCQRVKGGTLFSIPEIDAYSMRTLEISDKPAVEADGELKVENEGDNVLMENELVRIILNQDGEITRFYDKIQNREVLLEGERGNVLQVFEDRPIDYDAWDIEIYYDDKSWDFEPAHYSKVIETGPIRVGFEVRRTFRNSEVRQRVYLYANDKRLDFDTWLDWHEHHILVKAAFPVKILSPTATFDIQWGNVERPTHRNTSWDWARFETCAHKWADLSEGDYGVSLLNDCKYGYDIHENIIRLTLVKSATEPDPDADQGEHQFLYSFFPHAGDWRNGTIPASYALNDPLIVRPLNGRAAGNSKLDSFVRTDAANVVIETVKKAESGDGIIVRLFENERKRGFFTLSCAFPLKAAYHCNLLEEDREELYIEDERKLQVGITPYQILTLRLVPEQVI